MTKMVEESVLEEDVADSRGMAMWKYFEARQGRSAVHEEIGDVVVLMCTPRMSLVVGQNLFIDGYVKLLSEYNVLLLTKSTEVLQSTKAIHSLVDWLSSAITML